MPLTKTGLKNISGHGPTLDVRADAGLAGTLQLTTRELTVVDGNILGQIDFQAPLDSAGTDAILVAASIWAEADATFSSSVNNTDLVFATAISETAAEQMRLDSSGNLHPVSDDAGALGLSCTGMVEYNERTGY